MKGTKTLRTIGAVALAAAVGLGYSTSANAIKIDSKYSVTYAKETITKDSERTVTGSGKFYALAPSHMIAGPADIIANDGDGAMYEVLFTLQNMVFDGTQLLEGALTRTGTGDGAQAVTWFAVSRGGASGDNFVMFTKNAATTGEDIGAMDMLTLTAQFAVTADGPGGITRTVTNKALSAGTGLSVTMTHENADAIKVVRALKVTVTPPAAVPQADASDDFMSFTGGTTTRMLRASLGTLTVDVESGIRDARVPSDTTADDMVDTTMVTLTGPKDDTDTDVGTNDGNAGIVAGEVLSSASSTAGSAVTFSGDFSFLKTLALSDNVNCTGSLTEIRKPSEDDRTMLTDMTMPMAAGEFMDGKTLCVVVDGDTAIPETEVYMAATEFKGPSLNMFPPMGGMHSLGAISRGGTTVHIPYLTTYEGYNQRLILRNRSGREASYMVEFVTEDGITASPESHSGMIAANEVMMIRIQDIVRLEGGSRTAATVTSNAAKGMLDVATTLVNKEDRSTDTETHMAQ